MRGKEIFEGKVVWITGASSGIGEALVYRFAKMGSEIIISSNDPAGLEKVRDKCGMDSERITCVPFDLASTGNILEIADQQINRTGKIDFLFNIGGVSQRSRIEETPLWLDRRIFEINYFGTVALTKAVLPWMIRQGSGYIVATSSITGRFGFPLRSAYSASKQAIHGFIETLYLENKVNNIRASVIIPGRVRTNISYHALNNEGKEHGIMDPGQENGISAEKAAAIIIKGIIKNKREILVGGKELALLHIRRICPWLFFRIADRIDSK
jgi:short-subunit dehydrogenase